MALYPIRAGATRQPRGVPVVRAEFLRYRPTLVVIPDCPAVSPGVAPRRLTHVNDMSFRGGKAFDFGSTGYIDLGSTALAPDSLAHTVVCVETLRSIGASSYGVLANYYLINSDSGNRFKIFHGGASTGYDNIIFGKHDASNPNARGFNFLDGYVGVEHKMVLRSASNTDWHVWSNGAKLAATGHTASTNLQTGGNVLGVTSTNDSSNHLDGTVRLFVLFATVLPDALCLSLSANPWQLFESDDFFYSAESGGILIPTLSAATVTSITQTTATPRVTLAF